MKTLLLLLFLSCNTYQKDADVYICDGPGAKKYHLNEHCKGLVNCQHRVIKMSLKQAARKGRTLCDYEK